MSITDSRTIPIQLVEGSPSTTFVAPNKFILRLPNTGFRTGKDEVALKSLSLQYSWPNISAAKGNNQMSYIWGGVTFPVIFGTGMWQFATMQEYLETVMVKNNHYLVDQNGLKRFYIQWVVNPVLYCLSLTVTPVPAALPAGWTNPAAVVLSGLTPQLVIPASLTRLTGFPAASYPAAPQASVYQTNSGIPQITDVSIINITSNIVTGSGLSLYPNVLNAFSVPSTQVPGTPIQIEPAILDWMPVQPQMTFTEIEIAFVNQLMQPIEIRDPVGFQLTMNVRRRA